MASDIEACPIGSLYAAHYEPDGSCHCSRDTNERKLSMCGTCSGSGKVHRPGTHRGLTTCPACRGEGVR